MEVSALAEAVNRLENGEASRGDVQAYASLLRRCGHACDITQGKRVHQMIAKYGTGSGISSDETFLGNLLVQMYGRCGSVEEAAKVFSKMPKRNVFSWNTMIAAYAQNGHFHQATDAFEKMPTRNIVSWNVMVATFGQFGRVEEARQMFDSMKNRSLISWNTMLAAYAQNGHGEAALDLFRAMDLEGFGADKGTFLAALDACACTGDVVTGKILHGFIREDPSLESNLELATTLLRMYAKCGSVDEAVKVFNRMSKQDVVAWNALVTAYAQNGHVGDARRAFEKMPQKSVVSWNAIISAYTQAGEISQARILFDQIPSKSIASWNTMLTGYAQNGHFREAATLVAMMDVDGLALNKVSLVCMAGAAAGLGDLSFANEVYLAATLHGLDLDVNVATSVVNMFGGCKCVASARRVFDLVRRKDAVLWTSMVAAYSQNDKLDEAKSLFDSMPSRDEVSWTAMVSGYARCGDPTQAATLFATMDLEGQTVTSKCLTGIFEACTNLKSLRFGTSIRRWMEEAGFDGDVGVKTAMVNMYGRCGHLSEARIVFDATPSWAIDLIMFTSMIGLYAQNGHTDESFSLFRVMHLEGVLPTAATFLGILTACSHAGLTKDGRSCFMSMNQDYYHEQPVHDHFACMIDLLGRAGKVEEALELALSMPFEPDIVIWKSVLAACRLHNRKSIAAECVAVLGSVTSAPYVLLSNTFTNAGS